MALQASWSRLRSSVPQGDGAPVLVIPGLTFDDSRTEALRSFLDEIGYHAYGWGNGVNLGYDAKVAAHTGQRLDDIAHQHGRKVNVIGHSLGGIFARELAKNHPSQAERVITLGSPFGGLPHPNSSVPGLRMVFGWINPVLDDLSKNIETVHARMMTPPSVPTSSVFTPIDGIVNALTCLNPKGRRTENIEIHSSHIGLVANPKSIVVMADRLAQDLHKWRPFDRSKYLSTLFENTRMHDDVAPTPPAADRIPALAF
jgi:pimeloyl-ACP methyl ester carboxylesterase